jgi:uncharacterized membrane protein
MTNDDTIVYTDYESGRYFKNYAEINASPSADIIENPTKVDDGYLLLRNNHLKEKGKLSFITGETGFGGIFVDYTIADFNKLSATINKNNRVYENSSNTLYTITFDS